MIDANLLSCLYSKYEAGTSRRSRKWKQRGINYVAWQTCGFIGRWWWWGGLHLYIVSYWHKSEKAPPCVRAGIRRSVASSWWVEIRARTGAAADLLRLSALHVAALTALAELWAPKARRDGSRCETSHNWAEWAFVSWLITADSWLSSPPPHAPLLSLLPSPLCLLCLAVHQWKRYY